MRTSILLLVALAGVSCRREAEEKGTPAAAPRPVALPSEAPASKLPDLVPRPKDKSQFDRLVLAGYTPHADHMHAPGVNECPMNKGTEAVM